MEFDIKTYGLIGKELNHSFSPSYFEEKFAIEGSDDCQYLPFPLKRVEDFVDLISDYSLNGLNVTLELLISFDLKFTLHLQFNI